MSKKNKKNELSPGTHSNDSHDRKPQNNNSEKNKQVPSYDYTKNLNVSDAQKNYELSVDAKRDVPASEIYVSSINKYRGVSGAIENRGIDRAELYEQSASGGAASSGMSKEFGVSEADIAQLLDTRDIVSSRGVKYKVSDSVGGSLNTVSHYLYNVSSSGTDFGTGMRQISTVASPVIMIAADCVMMSASKTLEKDLAFRLNKLSLDYGVFKNDITGFINNPDLGLTKKELLALQQELISKLSDSGLKGASPKGIVLYNQISNFIRENEYTLLKTELGAAKMLKEVARVRMINENILQRRRLLRGNLRTRLFRYIQQDDAGLGMVFTYNLYRRGYQTLKLGLRSVRFTAKNIALVGKLTLRESAKAAAFLAKIKLGQKIALSETGQTVKSGTSAIRKGARSISEKYIGTKSKLGNTRLGKMKKAFMDRHTRVKTFIRDPFRLKSHRNALLKRLGNTKIGRGINKILSPYKLVKQFLARLLSGIIATVSTLLSVVMVIFALLIFLVVLVVFIISIFMSFFSLFDLSSSEEDVIKEYLVYIKELSEEQNESLQSLSGRYANTKITYETIKNEDAYNNPDNAPERPVVETTNSAEIMSMAQVYFDFDLESAEKDKVKDYIKKLYNGSHLITVTEHERTYTDANGKEHTLTDADVAFKTYYFDQLFDCKLTGSGGVGVVAGNEITEQVWNYLRTAGVEPVQAAGIMGNMYGESGFDPNLVEHGNGIGFGLCQWSYGRRENLENFAASQGKSPGDLKVQLDFFMTEYNPGSFNSYYTGLDNYSMFMNASTPEDATYYFMWGWERPADWAGNSSIAKRQAAARTYYETYKDRELIIEEE